MTDNMFDSTLKIYDLNKTSFIDRSSLSANSISDKIRYLYIEIQISHNKGIPLRPIREIYIIWYAEKVPGKMVSRKMVPGKKNPRKNVLRQKNARKFE